MCGTKYCLMQTKITDKDLQDLEEVLKTEDEKMSRSGRIQKINFKLISFCNADKIPVPTKRQDVLSK